MNRHRYIICIAIVALTAGCATTRVSNEWRDPSLTGAALAGKRVLVACRAPDETLRRVCEDEWVRQLEGSGLRAVPAHTIAGFPAKAGDLSDELRDAARKSSAGAIATTTVQTSGGTTSWGYGPQVGVGVGGGGGSGGGFSFGGVGITLPIGGGQPAGVGLGYNTSIIDVASGKLLWSANAAAPTSGEQRTQVVELTRVTADAMRKAGLFN